MKLYMYYCFPWLFKSTPHLERRDKGKRHYQSCPRCLSWSRRQWNVITKPSYIKRVPWVRAEGRFEFETFSTARTQKPKQTKFCSLHVQWLILSSPSGISGVHWTASALSVPQLPLRPWTLLPRDNGHLKEPKGRQYTASCAIKRIPAEAGLPH